MVKDWHQNEVKSALPTQQLYDNYASHLKRYLRRRVQRSEDMADLTQEIFELFLRRKDHAKVIRDPLRYLFRIAFHVVGAALEEKRRNPVTFDSRQITEDLADLPSSTSEEAEELAVQADVRAALSQLPEHHLAALLLVAGQNMSYKEAARVSGLTPNTIATYVMHGRAAVRSALNDRWHSRDEIK